MGTMLKAKCTDCDFESAIIHYGTGMRGLPPNMPAIDKESGRFCEVEGLDGEEYFRYYHHSDMYKGEITDDFHQNFDIFLSPVNNLCPKCGNYAMRFDEVGNWD